MPMTDSFYLFQSYLGIRWDRKCACAKVLTQCIWANAFKTVSLHLLLLTGNDKIFDVVPLNTVSQLRTPLGQKAQESTPNKMIGQGPEGFQLLSPKHKMRALEKCIYPLEKMSISVDTRATKSSSVEAWSVSTHYFFVFLMSVPVIILIIRHLWCCVKSP